MPVSVSPRDSGHTFFANFRSGAGSTFQKQSIECQSREDGQGMPQVKTRTAPAGAHQFTFSNEFGFRAGLGKKRILFKSFVRQPAAARFFPGELFIEEENATSSSSQQLGGVGAGGAASHNGGGKGGSHSEATGNENRG